MHCVNCKCKFMEVSQKFELVMLEVWMYTPRNLETYMYSIANKRQLVCLNTRLVLSGKGCLCITSIFTYNVTACLHPCSSVLQCIFSDTGTVS